MRSSRADGDKNKKKEVQRYEQITAYWSSSSKGERFQENGKKFFEDYVNNLEYFYDQTKSLKNIKILQKDCVLNKTTAKDFDFGKIICLVDNKNVNLVEKFLRTYYNINVEMNGTNHILLMTSFCDEKSDFDYLIKALKEIDEKIDCKSDLSFENLPEDEISPVCVLSLAKAFYSKTEKVGFEDSVGLVSGEFIIPYPPGIPILAPGELITNQIIQKVKLFKATDIEIIGCEDISLDTINVIIE